VFVRRTIVKLKTNAKEGTLSTGCDYEGKASSSVGPLNKRKVVFEAVDVKKGQCDSSSLVDIYFCPIFNPSQRFQNSLIIILLII